MNISASILAADPLALGRQIEEIEQSGADMIHVDVTDKLYANNLTFGVHTVEHMAKVTQLPIDVHLELYYPDLYIHDFYNAGAKIITVQLDTCSSPIRILNTIKDLGMKAVLAINPHIPLHSVEYLKDYVDWLLLMSVEPGFGGQKFQKSVIPKIQQARQMFDDIPIAVDGGIGFDNIKILCDAGATIFNIGTALFKNNNIKNNIEKMRKIMNNKTT